MRVLALDWGTVRIGAAISDEEAKIAFAFDKYIDSKSALDEIKALVNEKKVEKIIIGLPKNLSGQDSKSSEAAEKFGQKIVDEIGIPVEYFDERFSSRGASSTLTAQGVSQKNQRGQVDNLAAQAMLQTYLDTNHN